MKHIAWLLLLLLLSLVLYLALGSTNSPVVSIEKNDTSLKEIKLVDSQRETRSDKLNTASRKVISGIQKDTENNSSTADETAALNEQLKELQKLTKMDLSKIEEGLKYALLNGSAEITPEGNISYGMDSTYVSDMQAHPSMGIGISREDYYAQDTNISQWARDTENQISAALNNPEFIKEFSDLTVYDFSCKDTICRISFSGRIVVSSIMTENFTYIPALDIWRSTSMGIDEDGNTHVYISRNMIKEHEY